MFGVSTIDQEVQRISVGLIVNISQSGKYAEAAIELAVENGFSFWLAGGQVMSGWSLAAGGAAERGIAKIRQGLNDWQATGSETYVTYYLGLLADSLGKQGQLRTCN